MEGNMFVWSGTLWLLEQMSARNGSVPTLEATESPVAPAETWSPSGPSSGQPSSSSSSSSRTPPSAAMSWEASSAAGTRPILVVGPKPGFVVRNRPATLTCRALYANRIRFKCNGHWVEQKDHVIKEGSDPVSNLPYIEASVPVHRKQVEEYFGLDGFQCECFASASKDEENQVKSDRVPVRVAFLRKHFYSSPAGERAPVGATLRLPCVPPEGDPKPELFWLRNGEEIHRSSDSNVILANDGSLIVSSARLSDSANYTCGARNLATKRLTPTATLHIYVDGAWSPWSSWAGDCGVDCALLSASRRRLPKQARHRICNSPPPQNGGAECGGASDEKIDCRLDCPVDGDWTLWSRWSSCDASCRSERSRVCADPLPQNGGRTCRGLPSQARDCAPELCKRAPVPPRLSSPSSSAEANLAMYAGLGVAGLLFVSLVALIAWLLCRRRRCCRGPKEGSYYAGSPGNLRTVLQPDVTQQAMLRQEDLQMPPGRCSSQGPPGLPELGSFSLRSGKSGSSSGYGGRPRLFLSGSKAALLEPATSSSNASSASSQAARRAVPRSRSRDSANSDENYATLYDFEAAAPECLQEPLMERSLLPSQIEVESLGVAVITAAGGRITLPNTGISLTIPSGALDPGQSVEAFVAVCREERPPLGDREALLSPVVWAGPPGVAWRKPLILTLPHAAQLFPASGWSLSLAGNEGAPGETGSFWTRLLTLGEETINSPAFAQLDLDRLHVMTETLGRLALVGRPSLGPSAAVKRMRLAAFAPLFPSALDFGLRIYVLEDLPTALQSVEDEEAAQGGCRVAEDGALLCAEAGDLAFCLEDVSPGWQVKPGAAYQEIPARHAWSAPPLLHCSFSLELGPEPRPLSARVVVLQKGGGARHVLNVSAGLQAERVGSRSGDSGVQTIVSGHSGRSSRASGPYAVSTALTGLPSDCGRGFPFPLGLKRALAERLDPPLESGNDWRMLARKLGVDGYIQFFGFRPSPSEHILDLWEARGGSAAQLAAVLAAMGRPDAVALLRAHLDGAPVAL